MKRFQRLALTFIVGLVVFGSAALLWRTKFEAHRLVTSPMEVRSLPIQTPADYGLPYEDVTVTSADGLKLVGWFVPSQNGAVIIMQHGYKGNREEMLNEAQMLHRHGYGALITSIRAHDYSDGETITFGKNEILDLNAWYAYLAARSDIDPERIGILGNSFGGMLAVEEAARNPGIKAVVADSAFSSLNDTIATTVRFYTGLPEFPFVPLIEFWAEHEVDFDANAIDATNWVAQISPRPIFLMQGGRDIVISASSGQRLYDAAGQPKELWFEPDLGHVAFDTELADEFERRVAVFFDRYLLER